MKPMAIPSMHEEHTSLARISMRSTGKKRNVRVLDPSHIDPRLQLKKERETEISCHDPDQGALRHREDARHGPRSVSTYRDGPTTDE